MMYKAAISKWLLCAALASDDVEEHNVPVDSWLLYMLQKEVTALLRVTETMIRISHPSCP